MMDLIERVSVANPVLLQANRYPPTYPANHMSRTSRPLLHEVFRCSGNRLIRRLSGGLSAQLQVLGDALGDR